MRAEGTTAALLGMILISCLPTSAAAQIPQSWEVSGGYSFMRDTMSDLSFPAGWTVGVARKLNPWLSTVAEIGGHHKTVPVIGSDASLAVHTFMAGARASTRVGDFIEFGQALAGLVRGSGTVFGFTNSDTQLGLQLGLGADYPLNHKLAARGEIDGRFMKTGREVRFLAGLAYAFP